MTFREFLEKVAIVATKPEWYVDYQKENPTESLDNARVQSWITISFEHFSLREAGVDFGQKPKSYFLPKPKRFPHELPDKESVLADLLSIANPESLDEPASTYVDNNIISGVEKIAAEV